MNMTKSWLFSYMIPHRPFEAGPVLSSSWRKVWRISHATSCRAAREPLKLETKDPKRHFGVPQFTVSSASLCSTRPLCVSMKCWPRKLKTPWRGGCCLCLDSFINPTRVLIRQKHKYVGNQMVNMLCFIVHLDSRQHIDFTLTGTMVDGASRVHRKRAAASTNKAADGDGVDEEQSYIFPVLFHFHFLPHEGMAVYGITPASY
ncbi:hypothetical protein RSAG8_13781, partial [Rhizoctonia solani AG-8 WAC10335]